MRLPPGGGAVALQQELLDELGEAGGVGRGPGGEAEGKLLHQGDAQGGVAGGEGRLSQVRTAATTVISAGDVT